MVLGIRTQLVLASELGLDEAEDPDDRIIDIVLEVGGDTYLSGVHGSNYMDLNKYKEAGIEVEFQKFICPEYKQLYDGFVPNLSILDLLFNHGKESIDIIRSGRG
jgi:hypothetical protein